MAGGAYAAQQGRAALHEISFTASPGQKIAIVGPSGAGKSTMFHLILRFYEPTSGSISLNNIDVTSMTRRDVRNHIGLVPQDPVLFSSTVLDNIAFGQPEASRADIEAAARQAQAHDFICQLTQGYDTPVGEKGVRLSGGQKQRVALARAVYQDCDTYLLDDPLSAVDAHVGKHIFNECIDGLLRDKTVLLPVRKQKNLNYVSCKHDHFAPR